MEKYAKELSSDGRVVIPNASRLLVSEDFHSGEYKEMAVNKGDGPPSAINSGKSFGQTNRQDSAPQKQQQQQQQQQPQQQQQKQVNTAVKKSDSVQVVIESRPDKLVNKSTSDPQENFKRTKSYDVESNDQKHIPLTRNSDIKILNEESPLRKKDSFVKPVGRLFDGEILPPSKPIEPGVFEIGQEDIEDSHRSHFRGEFGPHSGIHRARYLSEDRPIRQWRHRHAYYHHRPAPVLMGHQPGMYYMPMYGGRSNVQMAQFAPSEDARAAPLSEPGEGPAEEYGRQPVMMQPLVPMVSSAAAQPGFPLVPSQPMLQSPFVQQPEDRSNLYTVPMATAPQQPPQQFIYPLMAVPAIQQPQPQLQLVQQPALEQGARLNHLASHWTDEPGHERSEVREESEPKPREYDDEKNYDDAGRDSRYDEERYHGYNEDERMDERRYQDDRADSLREEEEREDERERLYRERGYYENSEPRYDQDTRYVDNADENGSVRSPPSLPVPTAAEESNEDDNEEENESEETERALQDSRDDPLPADEGPPEVERDDASPSLNYHQREMHSREQPSVIRIPSFSPPSPRMDSPFAYPGRFSTDTYSREQLLGPSAPLRERVLPRFMHTPPRMAPIESPNGDISEMSASEARFRERMRLELAAKDTIPKGHSDDGFKNVVIRLNGEPLENASELRSKIIDGRIVQGKGKTIKSKGPMRIRVTHKGKGKNRIKFIDISSPQKYSVTESRSKIGRAPTMSGSNHNLKKFKSWIHKKNGHGRRFPFHLRAKGVAAATNMSSNAKVHGNKNIKNE